MRIDGVSRETGPHLFGMLGMSLFFYLCTRNHESQSRLMGVKVY